MGSIRSWNRNVYSVFQVSTAAIGPGFSSVLVSITNGIDALCIHTLFGTNIGIMKTECKQNLYQAILLTVESSRPLASVLTYCRPQSRDIGVERASRAHSAS